MNTSYRMIVRLFALVIVASITLVSEARSFDFKFIKSNGESDGKPGNTFVSKSKYSIFQVKVSKASKKDNMEEMEIRAGTIMKNIVSKRTFINDVCVYSFLPTNTQSSVSFEVMTGAAMCVVDKKSYIIGDMSEGYTVAGVIIEAWQGGKCIKHWSNVPGRDAKLNLSNLEMGAFVESNGYKASSERYFKNKTRIYIPKPELVIK